MSNFPEAAPPIQQAKDLNIFNFEYLTSRTSLNLRFLPGMVVLMKTGIEFSCLKTPRLIHIDPDAIIRKLIIEITETLRPHVDAFVIKPVNKHRDLRPYLVDQVVIVLGRFEETRLDEDIILVAHRVVLVCKILC